MVKIHQKFQKKWSKMALKIGWKLVGNWIENWFEIDQIAQKIGLKIDWNWLKIGWKLDWNWSICFYLWKMKAAAGGIHIFINNNSIFLIKWSVDWKDRLVVFDWLIDWMANLSVGSCRWSVDWINGWVDLNNSIFHWLMMSDVDAFASTAIGSLEIGSIEWKIGLKWAKIGWKMIQFKFGSEITSNLVENWLKIGQNSPKIR